MRNCGHISRVKRGWRESMVLVPCRFDRLWETGCTAHCNVAPPDRLLVAQCGVQLHARHASLPCLPACQVAHGLAQFLSLLGAEEAADGVDEPAPLQHLLALHQLPPPSLGGGASPQAVGAGGHGLSAAADVG